MSVFALMLPVIASRGSPEAVRQRLLVAAGEVLDTLPDSPTLVVVSAGTEPLVEDVSALALPDRTIPVAGAPDLVAAIVSRGQVPRVQAAPLGDVAGAIAAAVLAARPGTRVVGVTVPAEADANAFEGVTAGLGGALLAAEQVTLVVSGNLGPTSGTRDTAAAEQVLAALRATDLPALEELSAAYPQRARLLAPTRLALGVLRDRGARLHVHAAEVLDAHLHVVGAGR